MPSPFPPPGQRISGSSPWNLSLEAHQDKVSMIRYHLLGLLTYYEALKPMERLQGVIDEVGDPFSGLTNPDPDHLSSPDLAACLRILRIWKLFARQNAKSGRQASCSVTAVANSCTPRPACCLRSRSLSSNHIYKRARLRALLRPEKARRRRKCPPPLCPPTIKSHQYLPGVGESPL